MERKGLRWFKTEMRDGRSWIFDPLRKRMVAFTPEEKVRQRALWLLVERMSVPAGRVAVEYSVKMNGLDKRADIVVFGPDASPLMVVECKAATVRLSETTLDQALRYHAALKPRFIMLYNGSDCRCLKVGESTLQPLDHLPDYQEMLSS